MRTLAALALLLSLSLSTAACVVGSEPDEDAVAGDGLGADDRTGTQTDGSGVGTIAARVCADGPTTLGVDVSYYQGTIDWSRAKAAGAKFAFLRVSDGAAFKDPKFATNWAATKAAGVIRGGYQFFRPAQSVTTQANLMIAAIGQYQPGDLPPVLDVEATGGLGATAIAGKLRQWVDLVKAGTGAEPIIYTGKYFWRDQVGGSRQFEDHALWIAQYTSQCPDLPSPWTRWTFWQNSDRGTIPGIPSKVDLDKFNGTYEDLLAFAQGSTPVARAAALPFHWVRNTSGSYTFVAAPPAGVARVEIRIEDYLIGAPAAAGGQATLDYTFNVARAARVIEVRGVNAAGAVIAVGNGLIDSTATPQVFVDQTGEQEYEIGLEDPSAAATVEVFADTFPLADSVSGRTASLRGMVRYAFTSSGDHQLKIVSRDGTGAIVATVTRTLHVR